MRFLWFFLLVAISAAVLPVRRADADHGVFKPETFMLTNGMQVVVVTNRRVPVVTHMVWYKTGSADEPPGRSGVAHLLEHMMFKGTRKWPAGEFSKIVARNGGTENAFTSLDYTAYFQTVAVDRLEMVMEMEADRMTNLILDPKEIETERLVVLEERRQRIGNDPGQLLGEHVNAALYLNYPYRRPVIGWEDELKGLAIEDLAGFYRQWYRPSNAILVVAGDISAVELKPLAERTYGQIPASPEVKRNRPAEPPHSADRRVSLRDARVRQPSLSRIYLAPSFSTPVAGGAGIEHVYALEILAEVLGGGASSPIYRSLVIDSRQAVSAGAAYGADGLGPARFVFYASPRPGVSMGALEAALITEIEKITADGIAEVEVERAKQRMIAEAVYARDSLTTGARVLGSALASGRSIANVEGWTHRIEAVTADAVNAAARALIAGRPSVTALLLVNGGQEP